MNDRALLAPAWKIESEGTSRRVAGEDPAKRRQILKGAREVFGAEGFDAASMSDVARVSGVSKSTLYVYFRNKEELFIGLISEVRDRYFAEIEAIFADPAHPTEALRTYGMKLATLLTSTQVVRANRTVIAVADRMPSVGRDFFEQGPERAIKLLSRYIAAAVEADTLDVEDPHQAAAQFVELAMAGLFRRRLFNHLAEEPTVAQIEATVDAAVRLFLAGYGPKAA